MACCSAGEQCSLQDLETSEAGAEAFFLVSYVRGLETRVAELEARLVSHQSEEPSDQSVQIHTPQSASGGPAALTRTTTLEEELKDLSLEAAADRYLGQSSGLSFARLTQAVLRRLQPDQYIFGHQGPTAAATPGSHGGNSGKRHDDSTLFLDEAPNLAANISHERATYLANCYWEHSATLYPFVQREWFDQNLAIMYTDQAAATIRSRVWLYTMWMVLAIGATARSSLLMSDETEPRVYFDFAMEHFDAALSSQATVALSAILLQVSYSFFNKVGPNSWYLVGVAIRIAVGIGLHTAPSPAVLALPIDEQEHRKRLFYSLYMMDRLVSISLGRPFGIQDDDIEIELFADSQSDDAQIGLSRPHLHFRSSPLAVPLHIVRLRRIAGRIFTQVYSGRNKHLDAGQRDGILQALHAELIDWRRSMPFPLPVSRALPVPQFSTAWYDLNYYQHVLMLYRPSPLCPVLTVEKVSIIAEAASMFVSQVSALQLEKRYAFNWLNLFNVFTVSLTLIYSTIAQPTPLPDYLRATKALDDLRTVSGILAIFGRRFPSALKCMALVQDVVTKLELRTNSNSRIVSDPHRISVLGNSLNEAPLEPHSAYPMLSTGSIAFDDLQEQVRQPSAQGIEAVDMANDSMLDNEQQTDFLNDFDFSATDLGNAAAQVMANGMITSASMDMDEEMMQLLDGVWPE